MRKRKAALARKVAASNAIAAAGLEQADALDPLVCRRYVEEQFSSERMVDDYVAAYRKAIERG